MAGGRMGPVRNPLAAILSGGASAGLGDGPLLERFAEHRGRNDNAAEAAFSALVARHGPMVLSTCRALTHQPHDADDAFQATFLVLARRAGSIRQPDRLGPWLHGVAVQIARKVRARDARRVEVSLDARGNDLPSAQPPPDARATMAEEAAAVHEEVGRLPERYRRVVVLCYLEGLTHQEAARRLGCPTGTVSVRLMRAKDLLRSRLERRGIAPSSTGVLAAVLASRPARAAVPEALARSTIQAAPAFGAGQATTLTASAVALAQGALSTMSLTKLTTISACVCMTIGLASTGAGVVVGPFPGDDPAEVPQPPPAVAQASPPQALALASRETVMWRARLLADATEDPAQRAEMLLRLGDSQARQGHMATALDTLNAAYQAAEAIPLNTRYVIPHPIVRIAASFSRLGDHEAAHRTFARAVEVVAAQDLQHQFQDWASLIPALHEAGQAEVLADAAEKYMRFVEEQFGADEVAGAKIQLEAVQGRFDEALALISDLQPRISADADSWERGVRLMVAEQLIPADEAIADRVLEQAKAAIGDAEWAPRRVDDWDMIARIELRLGRIEAALATVEEIPTEGFPVGLESRGNFKKAQTLAAIAEAQLAAGDQSSAQETGRKALQVAESIEEWSWRATPLSQALAVLIQAGDLDTARRAIEACPPSERSWALLRLATALERAGDADAARAARREALQAAELELQEALARDPDVPPDVPPGRHVGHRAARVAELHAQLSDWPAAIRVVDGLESEAARQQAFAQFARSRAEAGDLESVRILIGRLDTIEARDKAWFEAAIALPAPEPPTPPAP